MHHGRIEDRAISEHGHLFMKFWGVEFVVRFWVNCCVGSFPHIMFTPQSQKVRKEEVSRTLIHHTLSVQHTHSAINGLRDFHRNAGSIHFLTISMTEASVIGWRENERDNAQHL